MKNYEKPIVLSNEDIAEGVYAASGAVDSSGAGVAGGSASVTKVELAGLGNADWKVNTYNITIQNNGSEDLAEWTASVYVTSGTVDSVQVYNGWQASASYTNGVITIKPGGGGMIEAGKSITVSVVVSYSSDSITVG